MIAFPEKIGVPIVNHLTGHRYDLVPAADLEPDTATLARIVAICNEPEIYRWLFREPLEGRPYLEEKARAWIEWAKAGWHGKTHFVFAVLDANKAVAAACDIKSNDPSSEIGYWASREHRGVMTNAVAAMCTIAAEAGFIELFARTKKGNVQSQAVLERVGFDRRRAVATHIGDIRRLSPRMVQVSDYDWFIRTLAPKEMSPTPEPTTAIDRGLS